jgi:hypothetical protein
MKFSTLITSITLVGFSFAAQVKPQKVPDVPQGISTPDVPQDVSTPDVPQDIRTPDIPTDQPANIPDYTVCKRPKNQSIQQFEDIWNVKRQRPNIGKELQNILTDFNYNVKYKISKLGCLRIVTYSGGNG